MLDLHAIDIAADTQCRLRGIDAKTIDSNAMGDRYAVRDAITNLRNRFPSADSQTLAQRIVAAAINS